MTDGYYRMHRGWMENEVFGPWKSQPYSKREAWIWLIEHAAFRDRKVSSQGKQITLKRGQLRVSMRGLADAWNWKKDAVGTFIGRLTGWSMVTTAKATAGQTAETILTICNYEKYQASAEGGPDSNSDNKTDRTQTAGRQHADKQERKIDNIPIKKSPTEIQKKPDQYSAEEKKTLCPFEVGDLPPDEYLILIRKRGYCEQWAASEFLKFVSHAHRKNVMHEKWRGAWATWIANAERYAAADGKTIPQAQSQPTGKPIENFWEGAGHAQQVRAVELFYLQFKWDTSWGPEPDKEGNQVPPDVHAEAYRRARGKDLPTEH